MNTSSIKEIHEHLKHQTHKFTLNPEIPKLRANNPFVNLIFGTNLVYPKFLSQPRLLAQPNSTMGPSIRERKQEREPAINELGAASQAVDWFASIATQTPSRIHLQPILVSQTDSPQSPHEPALYHFVFSEPPISGFWFAFIKLGLWNAVAQVSWSRHHPAPFFFFFFVLFSFILWADLMEKASHEWCV